MRALTFWKKIAMDRVDFLERLIALLKSHGVRYCVIGGRRSMRMPNRSSASISIWLLRRISFRKWKRFSPKRLKSSVFLTV